ncbi:MAG TPA: septal ring lytic transglycosylase RlpA family protein [Desulfobacterales bacterium]|nr:septal ring lytic transglycosylase RlpA family protein [Desulfobacterales bacterium]
MAFDEAINNGMGMVTTTAQLKNRCRLLAGGAAVAILLAVLQGCAARPHPSSPASTSLPSPRTEAPPESIPGQPRPYKALGKWYQPIPDANGFRQQGLASWYGPDFHGKRASSGEIYDMHAMTAAHRTLPIGTLVRVRQLENNRTVEVRINDRGPFVRERERIIDLSYEAARHLGVVGPGTAPVEVVAVGAAPGSPVDLYSGNFTFQVGAFASRENAERLRAELNPRFGNAHIVTFDRGDRVFYRVRVGKCLSLEEASAYEEQLMRNGFPDAFAVAE